MQSAEKRVQARVMIGFDFVSVQWKEEWPAFFKVIVWRS